MPTTPDDRFGFTAPLAAEPVATWDEQFRLLVAGIHDKVEELATASTFLPNSSTPTYPTPPASPREGQRWLVRLQRYTPTNRSYYEAQWRFRYSTAVGRWMFDGGSPWINAIPTPPTPGPGFGSSGIPNLWTTAGLWLRAPLQGVYDVAYGYNWAKSSSVNGTQQLDLGILDGSTVLNYHPQEGFVAGPLQGQYPLALAQGATVQPALRGYVAGGADQFQWSGAFVKLTPLYLGALLT